MVLRINWGANQMSQGCERYNELSNAPDEASTCFCHGTYLNIGHLWRSGAQRPTALTVWFSGRDGLRAVRRIKMLIN
jgi:hypothetical protein